MTLNELVGKHLFNWNDDCEHPLDLKFLDLTSCPDETGYFSYSTEWDWVPISGLYAPDEYLSGEYANAEVVALAAAGEDSFRIQVVCHDKEPEPVALEPTSKNYTMGVCYGWHEEKDGIMHSFTLDLGGGTVPERRRRMDETVKYLAADLGCEPEDDSFNWGVWSMKIPEEMVEKIRQDAIADYLVSKE